MDLLNEVLAARGDPHVEARHFRANLMLADGRGDSDGRPRLLSLDQGEYAWTALRLPTAPGTAAAADAAETLATASAAPPRLALAVTGPCSSCSMVDVDPTSGVKNGAALGALASYTRQRARIMFGVFCELAAPIDLGRDCTDTVWIVPGVTIEIDSARLQGGNSARSRKPRIASSGGASASSPSASGASAGADSTDLAFGANMSCV